MHRMILLVHLDCLSKCKSLAVDGLVPLLLANLVPVGLEFVLQPVFGLVRHVKIQSDLGLGFLALFFGSSS